MSSLRRFSPAVSSTTTVPPLLPATRRALCVGANQIDFRGSTRCTEVPDEHCKFLGLDYRTSARICSSRKCPWHQTLLVHQEHFPKKFKDLDATKLYQDVVQANESLRGNVLQEEAVTTVGCFTWLFQESTITARSYRFWWYQSRKELRKYSKCFLQGRYE